MNPMLLKTFAGVAVRAFMLLLGAHGVELAPDDKDSLLRGLEIVINGLLIAVPILWSLAQKWWAHQRIQSAELSAELAQRR